MLARAADQTGLFFVLDEPARILVVDDDPGLRAFACSHLATPDITLETAGNCVEALAHLDIAAYDLVLVGLDMPMMDGCELITRMRAEEATRHIPVVVVTAREDTAAIDRAFRAGATSFVVKPLNWVLLSYQLRYVLRACGHANEVRLAKERAEQAHAIKANVLRLVQHELRTPLTSIVGFAEHIEAYPKSSEVAEFAALIARAGRRFTSNVADLIGAAQLLTTELKLRLDDCRVGQVVEAVVAAETPTAHDAGVEIRVHDATENVRLECDRDMLARALKHLVRNAVQHGEGPVDIMIGFEREAIVFAVRDRGQGIPQSQLANCFEAFQQGDDALNRTAAGLGLGLPVARRVFTAHGGTLTVSYIKGIGCVAMGTVPRLGPQRPASSSL